MIEYGLYLESGPRRRKTMVHVLDLLGCVTRGPTTEEALDATPDAIRAFLRFLQRHGEQVEPEADFCTVVVEHVMEGPWLGNGNPAGGFGPDFEPLEPAEQAILLRRLGWLQSDMLRLIDGMPPAELAAEPEGKGRSIHRILEHVVESQCAYLRAALGKVEGLAYAMRAVRQGPQALPIALAGVWEITDARLEQMTEPERALLIQRGQVAWTARRALRRMLEHGWEHLVEVAARVSEPLL